MKDPPMKLFGQTISFTASGSSSLEDAVDGPGMTSTGAWREMSSSPTKDVREIGADSVPRTELTALDGQSSCFGELSSCESICGEEDKQSSPRESFGQVVPGSSAGDGRGRAGEDAEEIDADDAAGLEGSIGQEEAEDDVAGKGPKMPRRPDKAVACPRCHSLETKFCYYNNYNVNQPRHFCKHCQRYWTAGGTLRNVPVGAGRRKNKHGSVISSRQNGEGVLVRGDEPDVASPLLAGKAAVAHSVPMQVPVVQAAMSTKSMMRVPVAANNSPDTGVPIPYTVRVPSLEAAYIITSSEAAKSGDTDMIAGSLPPDAPNEMDGDRSGWQSRDESAGQPAAGTIGPPQAGPTLSHAIKGEPGAAREFPKEGDVTVSWGNGPGVPHGATGPYGFFNGGWPYGYNVGWSGNAAFCAGAGASGNGLPPPPANVAAAWGGAAAAGSMWTGMSWAMPGLAWTPAGWCPPPWSMGPWAMGAPPPPGVTVAMVPRGIPTSGGVAPDSVPSGSFGAVPMSSPLGKHDRGFEGGTPEASVGSTDRALWAPKSLRMADPEEAMRSSVWRILKEGSRPEVTATTPNTFRACEPKNDNKKIAEDDQQTAQTTLQANPAAMSRSLYFQESN